MTRATLPNLGSLGVLRDPPAHEIDPSALSDGLNLRMRDGCAERIVGEAQVFTTPAVTPYWVGLYATPLARYVVHAGTAAVYADDGATRANITGAALNGAVDNRFTGGVLGGVLVLNNGVDKPRYWGGSGSLADLPAWGATWKCAVMRAHKNYLIALDVTKGATRYPHMVKWSSAADPGTVPASWNEADPAVDAGELDLAETTDRMVDALPLGDSLVIYKGSSMYAMTYIGGAYIWQFRRLPGETGMLAAGCGCIVPGGHLVLTAGDVVLHNGAGVQSILGGRMRRWLFDQIDPTNYARSFVVSNPALDEAWVCFPTNGSAACDRALIWSWKDNTLSVRELNAATYACSGQFDASADPSWAGDAAAWSSDATTWSQSDIPPQQARLLISSAAPKLLVADSGNTFAGAAYTARAERLGLAFGAPERVKLVRSIVPRIDGATGQTVQIQVGGAMDVEGPYTWSDPVAHTIGTSYKTDLMATGRFLAWRVQSTGSFSWRIRSIDLDIVQQGAY